MHKRVNEVEKSGVEELRAQGVQVVTEVDRESFQALIVRSAYPQYANVSVLLRLHGYGRCSNSR
jgi:TRAP-type C4-dicarboxylate transport system substrate-binding protein